MPRRKLLFTVPFFVAFLLLSSPIAADFSSCLSNPAIPDDPASADPPLVATTSDSAYPELSTRGLYPSPTPAVVVEVHSVPQLKRTVACAAQFYSSVCVRSGGHDFVGGSSCSGAQIDVHKLKGFSYNSRSKTVTFEPGITLGELLYEIHEASSGTRMLGVGLCPSVGSAGYLLGGGHNPYSGKTGLTCDSMVAVELVTVAGEVVTANAGDTGFLGEVFAASCGAGGGHFGVVTSFTYDTHDAEDFHENVYFRYLWPLSAAGEVIRKWMVYDQHGGENWVRLEVNKGSGVFAYGVCWDEDSAEECEERLAEADFFNVPGRETWILEEADSYLDFQKWIGPAGDWAFKVPTVSAEEALVGKNFIERELGVNRLYASAFLKFEDGAIPAADVFQTYAEICSAASTAVGFLLCQFNPWKGKNVNTSVENAFPHRGVDAFVELILGNDLDMPSNLREEMQRIETEILQITRPYIAGIYNNYPEFGLEEQEYQYLYWGQSLPRLSKLRIRMDPDGVLDQLQQIPLTLECPGSLEVDAGQREGSKDKFGLSIAGYAGGQRPGMQVTFQLGDFGCVLDEDTTKATVERLASSTVNSESAKVTVWTATVLNSKPFTVVVNNPDNAKCEPTVVLINSVECGTVRFPDGSKISDSPTPSTPTESDRECFPSTSMVELESGLHRRMDEVQVGDRVRVSATTFSDVYFFSHRTNTQPVPYRRIRAVAGNGATSSLVVSDGHYLPVNSSLLVAAAELGPGDMLELDTGDRGFVVSSEVIWASGQFNPHTVDGAIVVDGVVCSCLTTAVHPVVARVLLAPLRIVYLVLKICRVQRLGQWFSFFDSSRPALARLLWRGPKLVL